ncbi:MAG TPA: hypothetical protein VGJ33_18765 [Candidatus Angelobacter sp.]
MKELNDPKILEADLRKYESWRTRWDNVRQQAAIPSFRFYTATAQSRQQWGEATVPDVEVLDLSRDPARPTGAHFGALVHATVAAVPLDSSDDQVRQIVSLYARVLGAGENEVFAAIVVVRTTLDHPLLQRALKADAHGFCRRETPMTLTLSDWMCDRRCTGSRFFRRKSLNRG